MSLKTNDPKNEIVNGIRKVETAKAFGFDFGTVDWRGKPRTLFLPKSQIVVFPKNDGTTDVLMPQWMAKKNGLI